VVGLMIYLGIDRAKDAYVRRVAALSCLGFFKGATIGPLIQLTVHIDPTIIITAFLATSTVRFVSLFLRFFVAFVVRLLACLFVIALFFFSI
jgi:hypothetical protein